MATLPMQACGNQECDAYQDAKNSTGDHGPPAEGAASFHTTRWTIVMKAAQSQAQGAEPALAELDRKSVV